MADQDLVLSIILQGQDRTSPEIARVRENLRALGREVEVLNRTAVTLSAGIVRPSVAPAVPPPAAVASSRVTRQTVAGLPAAGPLPFDAQAIIGTLDKAHQQLERLQRDAQPAAAAVGALGPALADPARRLAELEKASGALKAIQASAGDGAVAKGALKDFDAAARSLAALQRAQRGLQQAAQAASTPRRGEDEAAQAARTVAALSSVTRAYQQLAREQEKAEAALKRDTAHTGGGLNPVGLVTGVALAAGTIAALERGLSGLADVTLGANSRLDETRAIFEGYTKSAGAAAAILGDLQAESRRVPFFDPNEVLRAGQTLISAARGSRTELAELVRTAEILAATNPAQGLEGAAFALREAVSGDFTSAIERFDLPRQLINRLRQEGVPNLEVIRRALAETGASSALLDRLGQTFGNRLAEINNFTRELAQRSSAGIFDRFSADLGRVTNFLRRDGDALRQEADRIGSVLGALFGRLEGAVGAVGKRLLNAVDPGLGDTLAAQFAAIPPAVEAAQAQLQRADAAAQHLDQLLTLDAGRQGLQAAGTDADRLRSLLAQTEPAAQRVDRALAELGIRSSQVQLNADRARQAYEAQIGPLQRQLDALRDTVDVGQEQARLNLELEATDARRAALAADQHRAERDALTAEQEDIRTQQRALELDRSLPRLERRREAIEATPDTARTDRQRAELLAIRAVELERQQLALQPGPEVRRLEQAAAAVDAQREALDLDKQHTQALKDIAALPLEARVRDLTKAEQDAIEPLQRQLDTLHDQQATLQLQRDSWGLLRTDIEAATEAANRMPRAQVGVDGPSDAEMAQRQLELRADGERLADTLLGSYERWIAANGGTAWAAITKSLNEWVAGPGKSPVQQAGEAVGEALFEGAKRGLLHTLGLDRVGGGNGTVPPPPPPSPLDRTPLPSASARVQEHPPESVRPAAGQSTAPTQTDAMRAAEARYRALQAQAAAAAAQAERATTPPPATFPGQTPQQQAAEERYRRLQTEMEAQARNAGAAFSDTLAAGAGDAQAAGGELAGAAEQGSAERLEIRSPSRVFMRLGEQSVAGYLAALDAGQGDVLQQVRRLLDVSVADLPPLPTIPAPLIERPVIPLPELPDLPTLRIPVELARLGGADPDRPGGADREGAVAAALPALGPAGPGAGNALPPVHVHIAAGAFVGMGGGAGDGITEADVRRVVEDSIHQALREYNAVRQRTLPGAPSALAGVRR